MVPCSSCHVSFRIRSSSSSKWSSTSGGGHKTLFSLSTSFSPGNWSTRQGDYSFHVLVSVGGGGRGGELISVHLANGQTIFAYHAETGHNIHNVQYNDDMSTRCYCLRGRQYQRPLFVLHSSMERKRREGPRSVPSLHAQIGMSLFYVLLLKIITEDVCNPLLNWMLGDEEEDGKGGEL